MILPLLLLPLVSLGVVAQHPGQRQTVDFSPQPSYRLVFPPTHFTPATYVCTGSNIKFQTNHAHRLTQEIERLCEEAIEKIKKKPCPPQAMIAEYDRNGAECKRLKEEAKNAYNTWNLACKHARNGNGRDRSRDEILSDHSSANQLRQEFKRLNNEAKNSCRSLTERQKALERMERYCLWKKEMKEKQYGSQITHELKKYLKTLKQTPKST
ncbi:hypothetical protein BASA62_000952 [Batrachochytrium salamandrivorans]|nr:hypothetical protein BASA62_000952 [Batrachochytrium salamandrivorans]